MTRALLFLFSFISTALALGSTLPRAGLVAPQYSGEPTPSSNDPPPANPPPSGSSNLTGDFQCGQAMCISAVVNGSIVEYTLTANRRVGWMGMGFGGQMVNTPMVLMWPNGDEPFTLSHRRASAYAMPAVDTNPPREARLNTAKSTVNASSSKLVFTIEANRDTTQRVIYALGADSPSSSSVDATFSQHVDQGTLTLNLLKSSTGDQGSNSISSGSIPLTSEQRIIVAHAVLCTVGFLVLLPAGALLARYFRTFTHTWFKGHWIIQLGIAGPIILIGIILGISAVAQGSNIHFNDVHKRWGLGVFLLYILQCSLGAFIHFVKPKSQSRRPPQNYGHAVLGLIVIGLAIYQVRSGYNVEWLRATGRGSVHGAINVIWILWAVLLPLLYIGGLAFLPKQWRQEQRSRYTTRDRGDLDHVRMESWANK